MKLNKINEVWSSANLLFIWHFGLLSSKIFATVATWRNDFYYFWILKQWAHLKITLSVSLFNFLFYFLFTLKELDEMEKELDETENSDWT